MSCTSRTVAGLLMLASAGLIAGCSQTDPGNEPGDPDFTACDPEETVPLDSVESRNSHPKFSILGMQDIGDPLPAMDHAIVVDESSVLHCFWTRGRDWQHGTSTNFGHASSSDMVSWTAYPHVTLVSSAYEIDRVWAPQVIREDSSWHMYFTGVEIFADDAENIQRIFVSRSADLRTWSEADLILEPSHELIAWGNGTPWANAGRDQMVFRHDGTLKMLLTVKLTNGKHSLALAERTGAGWEVVDVLETIQGEIIESPFLYEQEGLLHLFLNNWRDGGQAAWTSASLLGVWSRQVNELRGFAFELLELDSGYLMASRVWGSSILFTQFSLQDYESTNMVFPECYTGENTLLSFGDNIIDVGVPLN